MQLTTYTDFSLRILLTLAARPLNERVTTAYLAEHLHISKNHLSKIVNQLGHLGYLKNTRGKGGGLQLAMPSENINIGKIIGQLEPTLEAVNCQTPACPLISQCQLKGLLNEATNAFISVLAEKNLSDLLPKTSS
ncbi:MAG: Rrf2 family transcriptional regulator [Methylococcales bacterium]|jgi:Rrf2 family transcriptional regulator, nitric oxide-sensitive transcriptional repressor|nr:Rrf2 family transcriptional regulator [Methylococcales bacterium]